MPYLNFHRVDSETVEQLKKCSRGELSAAGRASEVSEVVLMGARLGYFSLLVLLTFSKKENGSIFDLMTPIDFSPNREIIRIDLLCILLHHIIYRRIMYYDN